MIIGRLAKLAYKMTPKRKAALAKAVKASALARKNSVKFTKGPAAAKKLTKLNARIAANKSALTRISKKNIDTVYRLQTLKGKGPLIGSKGYRIYAAMPSTIKRGVKVSPVGNANRRRAALLKKIAPPGTKFENIKFNKGDRFAFDSVAQSQKYFSMGEQAYFKTHGYSLTKLTNVRVVGRTATQVTFNTPNNLKKLQREATALAKKYERMSRK